MKGTKCNHAYRYNGEAVKTGGNGIVERYRELLSCVYCGDATNGNWKIRRVAVPVHIERSAEEIRAMCESLYGPEE